MNLDEFKEIFYDYIKDRKYQEALSLVDDAIKSKIPADQLITQGIANNLKRFQSFFEVGYEHISAFQLLAIGKISEDSIEKIKPYLSKDKVQEIKKIIVIGTIKSDFHGLGKKILKLFLEMENFKVIDLGLDVAPETFVEVIKTFNADYVFVSTMMLHNIIGIKRVGDLLIQNNLRNKTKFFVGGAPFIYNYGLIAKVGADDSAQDVYELLDKLQGRSFKKTARFKNLLRFFGRDK